MSTPDLAAGGPDRRPWIGPALEPDFFAAPTPAVARGLLGTILVRRGPGTRRIRAARIVETEAYLTGDEASHAYKGPTPRNRSMFLGPGHLYVYRIHQVHCLNVTTRPGEAVLVRAAEPLTAGLPPLTGPGRLCRGLGIDHAFDGHPLGEQTVELRDRGPHPPRVHVTRRIGIQRAVSRPLRFVIADSPWASRRSVP